MVHIFHNKETPLYKRFPDGWATKAKCKTLPVPIPSQPRLNIVDIFLDCISGTYPVSSQVSPSLTLSEFHSASLTHRGVR